MKRFLFLLFFATIACSQHEGKTTITIAAAASLSESLLEMESMIEEAYPEIDVLFHFGGSGSLRNQIIQGAPIDLFLFASKQDTEILTNQKQTKKVSILLENRLAVIQPAESNLPSFNDFLKSDRKIAIGTPETVPAGMYAKEWLDSIGVWNEVKDRIIFTKDVLHVKMLVETKAVDAGIVYVSDLEKNDKISVLEEIDPSLHSPIEYYIGIIENEQSDDAKEKVYQFLLSDKAIDVFQTHGFIPNE
jgi:molybdate transport system substrate-binding protein